MLIVDNTLNRDDHYSIFHFILKSIHYVWEQTLEKFGNLKNWVIIGSLWDKYGGKRSFSPLLLKILDTPLMPKII